MQKQPGDVHDKRLIIISGMSGAGKSVALHTLEDLGYYCIDNLPADFLKAVVDDMLTDDSARAGLVAVGIDARNRQEDLLAVPGVIHEFSEREIATDLLFFQASEDVLLQRFRETRRRHPLSDEKTELREAIARERDIRAEIASAANLTIDTSNTSIYELADTIRQRVDRRGHKVLSVLVESFGFKHGIPADADFVFDLRALPNPYWTVKLRGLTGLDPEVIDFLDKAENVEAMHDDIVGFLTRWIPRWKDSDRGYMTIAIGCTGGQHRSVYMTERVASSLREIHDPVNVLHSALSRAGIEQ